MSSKYFKVKSGVSTPNVTFYSNSANSAIEVAYLSSNVLSFSGASGQLFSIADSMSGTIFAVNDISGVPSIEVDDDGTIRLAETFGNVLIGTATDNGGKLQVNGTISANSIAVTSDLTIADKIVHSNDLNTSIRFPAADTITMETEGVERLRVSNTGNISIGTSATFYAANNRTTLSINGTNQSLLALGAGGSQKGYLYTDGSSIIMGSDAGSMGFTVTSAEPITFDTNNTERVRINASGNVGIMTTNPTTALDVNGTVKANTFIGDGSGLTNLPSGVSTGKAIAMAIVFG
jgi:hypothetical protein